MLIAVEAEISAPVEDVFSIFGYSREAVRLNPEILSVTYENGSELELVPGSSLVLKVLANQREWNQRVEILECSAPRRMVSRLTDKASETCISLDTVEQGEKVRIRLNFTVRYKSFYYKLMEPLLALRLIKLFRASTLRSFRHVQPDFPESSLRIRVTTVGLPPQLLAGLIWIGLVFGFFAFFRFTGI